MISLIGLLHLKDGPYFARVRQLMKGETAAEATITAGGIQVPNKPGEGGSSRKGQATCRTPSQKMF